MGWVVIDTNQAIRMTASLISHQCAEIEGITLSPLVLSELLRSDNRKPIENLAHFPVRLGMLPGRVMRCVASLRRSQIVAFSPFYNRTSQEVQRFLLDLPAQKVQKFVAEATKHIKNNGTLLESVRQEVRERLKSRGYNRRVFKPDGFAEALQKLATGPDNVIERLLMQSVSGNGTSSVRTGPHALYTGAMENPYLRHYFRTFLWYELSYQQVWGKQYSDWNLSSMNKKKNDWTDMTLSLYAAPGDIILTAEGTVRKAVLAVNPDGAIRTALAKDLYQTPS